MIKRGKMEYNILINIFIILSFFDIFIIKDKKKKFLIIILVLLIYLFFFGFRGFIAYDWKVYYPNFIDTIPLSKFFQIDQIKLNNDYKGFEIGFQIWVSFLKIFFSNWNTYLFFTTFIDISCLLIIFWRYSPYPIFSILLFLGFNGFQLQLDLMRNIKSILLFLFSIEYLQKNKYLKYFILNFLGVTFHMTSLVFIIIGYFLKKNFCKYKKLILFFFIVGIFFLIFSDEILYKILQFILQFSESISSKISYKLEFYLNSGFSNKRKLGIGFIERIITFLLFYINREKILKNKYGNIFFNIYLLYIFTFLYGSGVKIIFERIGLLFICSYWIIYPILLKNMLRTNKILIFTFIIIICLLKTIISFQYNYHKTKKLYNYKNILWIKEDYNKSVKIFEDL